MKTVSDVRKIGKQSGSTLSGMLADQNGKLIVLCNCLNHDWLSFSTIERGEFDNFRRSEQSETRGRRTDDQMGPFSEHGRFVA